MGQAIHNQEFFRERLGHMIFNFRELMARKDKQSPVRNSHNSVGKAPDLQCITAIRSEDAPLRGRRAHLANALIFPLIRPEHAA
jgi:hypothetical protein